MERRVFVRGLLALPVVALAAGCGGAPAGGTAPGPSTATDPLPAPLSVEVAQFKDATETVWRVADYLRTANLGGAPPTRHFVADANEAHTMLLEGRAPVVGMSFDDVIDCVRSGHPNADQVTTFYGVHRGFLSLVAEASIPAVGDLRAKTLAVDTYSGYASALFEILARAGLDYQTDLTVLLAGATNLRFTKLLNGEFTATLLGTPFDLLAEARGFRSLASVQASLGAYQGVVFAAQRSWLDQNMQTARHLAAVFANALNWASRAENRPVLKELIRASLPVAASDAEVDGIVDRLFGPRTEFCPPGTISRNDLAEVQWLFAKYRKVDLSGFDPASVIDARFLTIT